MSEESGICDGYDVDDVVVDGMYSDAGIRAVPSGWIQWKGTDVCMDVLCLCGEVTHVDGFGLYSFQCPGCDARYVLEPHIVLTPR